MSHLSLVRHQEIFNPKLHNPPIVIIGAGATGSRLWLSLVELGLTDIAIYDFDVVEEHNLANQIYLKHHVGMPKVAALRDYYELKTGNKAPESLRFYEQRVDRNTSDLAGVLFLLTDTMASRKEIFDHCTSAVGYMIETRMASAYGNIFTVNMCDQEQRSKWRGTLLDDDDPNIEVSACGSSISVGCTASLIANMAVWSFIQLFTMPEVVSDRVDAYFKPFLMAS